jgi:hypothetical protein
MAIRDFTITQISTCNAEADSERVVTGLGFKSANIPQLPLLLVTPGPLSLKGDKDSSLPSYIVKKG